MALGVGVLDLPVGEKQGPAHAELWPIAQIRDCFGLLDQPSDNPSEMGGNACLQGMKLPSF